ncbi:MAG: alpha/beta hydrolase [Rhodospirillaceae bacterium]
MQKSLEMENRTKRWKEQRWLLDTTIRTVGPEWDQGRLGHKGSRGGASGLSAFRRAGNRMKKFDDIGPEFGREGLRMEEIAKRFEDEGRTISACEHYFIAALLYASAQWSYFDNNEEDLKWEGRMIETYDKFIQYAPHPVERVNIPFGEKEMSAFLHLPPSGEGPFPCVFHVGGMDGSKENMVSLYGDSALVRGMAVLALDGPGQGETRNRGITITADNWGDAAHAVCDWLEQRPEIDSKRIVLRGSSFGTYYGTVATAALGNRALGYSGTGVCQEPGCDTIFNVASPTFKVRFMFMAGYESEEEFDKFRQDFDLRRVVKDIVTPYMIVAGEADQLSPIQHTYDLFNSIEAPKRLVVYQDANHSMAQASSGELGESRDSLVYDWLRDRVDGKPAVSEKCWIDHRGHMTTTPY